MIKKIPSYLPIDSNFIDDRRIKRLNKDIPNCSGLGMIFGIYFYLIKEQDMKCAFDDIDIIADELRTSVPLLKTVIESYNLFEIIEEENGKKFFSPYLDKALEPYFEMCKTNSINAKIGVAKRKAKQKKQLEELNLLSHSDSSQRPLNECSANRIEKNIKEENKRESFSKEDTLEVMENLKNQELDFDELNKMLIKKSLKKDIKNQKQQNLFDAKEEIDF